MQYQLKAMGTHRSKIFLVQILTVGYLQQNALGYVSRSYYPTSRTSFLPQTRTNRKPSYSSLYLSHRQDQEENEHSLESPPSRLMLEDDDDLLSSRSSLLQIHQLTVSQLKQQLRLRGMRVGGTKAELVQRLSQSMDPQGKRLHDHEDDDDVTVVDDWASSSWDDSTVIKNTKKDSVPKKSTAEKFAKQRGKELVDVTEYLEDTDKGKESKSVYISGNSPSSESTPLHTEEESSTYNPETWGDEAKIIDDYDGRSPVVDGLSRTLIEYRGSNRAMVQAYVVASRDSLKHFLAGGDRFARRNMTETEAQMRYIQLSKEKASRLPVKLDDIDGVDEDDEEGHYTHVMERDYGDWGKYSMTGVQLSSQEIKGLLLLTDTYGPFTESTKFLADKLAFELQPIVVFVPDLFRGKPWTDSSSDLRHRGKDSSEQEWLDGHSDIRVSVDIRAAAAALRQQYGVNSVTVLGMGFGGGKALEMAARVYPGNVLDDVGSSSGPPHVSPSAVVAWYPTNYDAKFLFGQDRVSVEAFDDYQTSVMAIFAEQDTLRGATTKDAEKLKSLLSEDERIKDMMVKVFSSQKHGFAHKFNTLVLDEHDRFDENKYGGEYASLDSGDAEAAYLLSSAFLETYSRTFLPTIGPPIADDENWSHLHMKDLSTNKSKDVRTEIQDLLAKHEDVDLDLGRMHPLDFMNPISDMEDVDESLAIAMKTKPYGLSPEDDADTMVEKLEAALERGDLGFLPGFGEIPMDDTEQAYW